jgi:hypothetical protein
LPPQTARSASVGSPQFSLQFEQSRDCLPRELVRSCIVQDRTARAGLCANSGGAKFAAHLNSYSQPSAKLVVLFPETGDSLDRAFFKNNSVPHGGTPRISVGDAVTRSFESSTRGGAFRDLNVCVPPYPEAQRAMWALLGLPGGVRLSEAVHVPGQRRASDLAAQGEISMIITHATLARTRRHGRAVRSVCPRPDRHAHQQIACRDRQKALPDWRTPGITQRQLQAWPVHC